MPPEQDEAGTAKWSDDLQKLAVAIATTPSATLGGRQRICFPEPTVFRAATLLRAAVAPLRAARRRRASLRGTPIRRTTDHFREADHRAAARGLYRRWLRFRRGSIEFR